MFLILLRHSFTRVMCLGLCFRGIPSYCLYLVSITHLAQGDRCFVSGSDTEAGVLRERHIGLVVDDDADTSGVRYRRDVLVLLNVHLEAETCLVTTHVELVQTNCRY